MADIFDSLLNLEEQYYDEGYAQGTTDGHQAGLIEGRIFGLERGFEKFLEIGKLQGRTAVWNSRIADPKYSNTSSQSLQITNPRAQKTVQQLRLILTNVPYKNDDDAVDEVEETLKKARVKARMVERMIGEKSEEEERKKDGGEESIEDMGKTAAAAAHALKALD